MHHALIMAGGSGTRLWPMSRAERPKQLIPFIDGKSLIRIAWDRLDGLVPPENRYVCAGFAHREAIMAELDGLPPKRYLGEPEGRDTLNAVGFGAAVIGQRDPDATIAVFTADHLIEPVEKFQRIVASGLKLADDAPNTLVTFGIEPTHAATGYGYLELGEPIPGHDARLVNAFKEKPDEPTAQKYHDAGPQSYLWNSGMFVWKAATLSDCIGRYEPEVARGLDRLAEAWDSDRRDATLNEVYPTLKRISVDFAVMERASEDEKVRVAAVPMPVSWLDVGSWPAFAQTRRKDGQGNAVSASKHVLLDSKNNLVASSDPDHVVTTIGCEDLLIVHTPDATLVCRADHAQDIKKLHGMVKEQFGEGYV